MPRPAKPRSTPTPKPPPKAPPKPKPKDSPRRPSTRPHASSSAPTSPKPRASAQAKPQPHSKTPSHASHSPASTPSANLPPPDRSRREAQGLLLGSHLSIAGDMCNAIRQAQHLGLSTVQVFTKNQQQWKSKPLQPDAIDQWLNLQAEAGFTDRTVSHASYLINLASPDDTLWARSIDLMHDEIERCEALQIPFLVHHPGAFTTSTLDQGLHRIARAYAELFNRTRGYRTTMCLENTAGGGSTIGRSFDELALLRQRILDQTPLPGRVGFCIDTCHAHAAGYDLSTQTSADNALTLLDQHLGFTNIRVLHLNDSKAPAGSRLDRHQHIGLGTIADAGFRAFLRCAPLRNKPMILETPKEDFSPGVPWDTVNLARLARLAEIA